MKNILGEATLAAPPVASVRYADQPKTTSAPVQPRRLESSPVHEDQEALAYDAMVRRYAWMLNKPFVRMLTRLGLPRARVLDIGTGPGWIPIELARQNPGWEIWGVDASEDMLALARRHAAQAGVAGRVHFVSGNATNLPFEAGFFDLAVSHFLLHHLERPRELFNEAARVTRKGGRVIVKDLRRAPVWKERMLLGFSKHVLRYGAEQLRMYQESLAAALTREEVLGELKASTLPHAAIRGFWSLDLVVDAMIQKGVKR